MCESCSILGIHGMVLSPASKLLTAQPVVRNGCSGATGHTPTLSALPHPLTSNYNTIRSSYVVNNEYPTLRNFVITDHLALCAHMFPFTELKRTPDTLPA